MPCVKLKQGRMSTSLGQLYQLLAPEPGLPWDICRGTFFLTWASTDVLVPRGRWKVLFSLYKSLAKLACKIFESHLILVFPRIRWMVVLTPKPLTNATKSYKSQTGVLRVKYSVAHMWS